MDDNKIMTRRILVVDDEPYVCEAIKMVLEMDGHNVVAASNGAEALEIFRAQPFDLLITDYSMPGMKGDELAAAAKVHNPALPIIMISAYVEKLTGEGTPLRHVSELVAKPFRLDEIKQAMQRVLSNGATTAAISA
jgi:CheY-like chemotaxis protein